MTRKTREELKDLSKEFLGTSSKWQKLVKGTLVDSGAKSKNGKPILTAKYMTEEEVLEMLRGLRQNKEQEALGAKVQEMAGGSVE